MAYAERTKVPVMQSRNEIERVLTKYGADAFGFATEPEHAIVFFRAHGRYLKFKMPLPRDNAHEERRRWRCLVLVIKAKLEAVESGIVSFENEFLPWIVLPSGETVAEWAGPQIEQGYLEGRMPTALLEGPKK